MTTRNDEIPGDLLTLEEVALLVDGADQVPRETARHLGPVIRTDPRFTRHVETVEALAQDAAIKPGSENRLADGVAANAELDRLLEAAGWTDPAEVLDPSGERGIRYAPLVHIARARAARDNGPSRLLRIVLVKLQRAALFNELRLEIAQLNAGVEALDTPTAQRLTSTLKRIDGILRRFGQAAKDLKS